MLSRKAVGTSQSRARPISVFPLVPLRILIKESPGRLNQLRDSGMLGDRIQWFVDWGVLREL